MTPRSAATSPVSQSFPQDLFPMDFLNFGMDQTSPNLALSTGQTPELGHGTLNSTLPQSEAGPSSQQRFSSANQTGSVYSDTGRDGGSVYSDAPSRGGSSRGKSRGGKGGNANVGSSNTRGPAGQVTGIMDIDQEMQQSQAQLEQYQSFQQQMNGQNLGFAPEITGLSGGEQTFEALMESLGGQMGDVTAGMLQQLEGIHMRSPIVFDPNNPSQPYNPMAQFLASPVGQSHADEGKTSRPVLMNGGLITPGASSEMYPQLRPEQMSPMRLEMFARENMEAMTDSPLEALQEQQRQFQEQLNALQVQQRQLQATAAAVAAVAGNQAQQGTSPYIPSSGQVSHSGPSSGHSRPVTTPGVHGSAEPTPSYFSPLTSPALEATRQYNSFAANNVRPPHPLSALSSPALNPIGSSGGAQQTLSPALNPQSNVDMSDPEYIRALVNMLDNSVSVDPNSAQMSGMQQSAYSQQMRQPYAASGSNPGSRFQSPSSFANPSHQSSPMTSSGNSYNQGGNQANASGSGASSSNTGNFSPAIGGPGPHRQSLPPKSRPSPLIKPVNHRSHVRQPSYPGMPVSHISSHPNSPLVMKGIQPGTYLPPAAVDQKMHAAASIASTPSPVDLAQIMPPPPVPKGQQKMTPMTPAALMNLGGGGESSTAGMNGSGILAGQGMAGVGMDIGLFDGGGYGYNDSSLSNHDNSQPDGFGGNSTSGNSNIFTSGSGSSRKSGRNNAYADVSQSHNSLLENPSGSGLYNGNGNGTGSARIQAKRASVSANNQNSATSNNASTAATTGKRGQKAGSAKKLAARPAGVGVRAATKASAAAQALLHPEGENRKTSHKAAEQKRRDSLKAGFDELRLLLPAINTEALDPETGEPIPGSSAPRLLPKSSLVPDDNPNRGVSKVALLRFGNEYIVKLSKRVDKRDDYIDRLRAEVKRLRDGGPEDDLDEMEEEAEDLLDVDIRAGEDDDFGPKADDDSGEGNGDENGDSERSGSGEMEGDEEEGEVEDEGMADDDDFEDLAENRKRSNLGIRRRGSGRKNGADNAGGLSTRRPGVTKQKSTASSGTVTAKSRRSG